MMTSPKDFNIFESMSALNKDLNNFHQALFDSLDIAHFIYVEIGCNGHFKMLDTHQAFFSDCFELQNQTNSHGVRLFHPVNWLATYPCVGVYLLDADRALEQQVKKYDFEIYKKHRLQRGIRFIKRQITPDDDIIQLFAYNSLSHSPMVSHQYVNCLVLLNETNMVFYEIFKHKIAAITPFSPNPAERLETKKTVDKLIKSSSLDDNIQALRALLYSKERKAKKIKISAREKEIVEWYLIGKSSIEIAQILGVTVHTVNMVFKRLKTKLNTHSRQQVALKCIQQNIIHLNDVIT